MKLESYQTRAAIGALEQAAESLRRLPIRGDKTSSNADDVANRLRADDLEAMADALRAGEALVP